MRSYLIGAASITMVALISCDTATTQHTAGAARTEFFDRSAIDSATRPADNFFQYANGNWIKLTAIPEDQSGWGSFYTLYQENLKNLNTILKDAAGKNASSGSMEQKLGDYYASGMDTVAIEKLGSEPIKPLLASIDTIRDYKGMMNFIAEKNAKDQGDLMGFNVEADDKNSAMAIPIFTQAGIHLPEKDYYMRTDSASVAARKAFVDYARTLFMLAGTDSAAASTKAQTVLSLETSLAKSHLSPADTRDPLENYHKMAIADLARMQPNINWPNYFAKMNVTIDSVNVRQPAYYTALNSMLATQPIDAWKTKLAFDYLSNNADLLSKAFRDASFNFSKTFSGQKVQEDRWKTIVNVVDASLPEMLGQLYVKKYFTEESKKRMDTLVNNLQTAFEARINKLDWMSSATKTRAVEKLHGFMKKIGYPQKWKNYDDVTVDRNAFFANSMAAKMHSKKEMIGKIGKPIDRTEWGMSTPTVNAYYNQSNNEIVFPAGILQFPFFDANADDAINYGSIGMVIGHEMTHGFDDQGSLYDDKGNMVNWWAPEDSVKFRIKTNGVINQYKAYTLFDSMHVNGELTLGENLADIGGLAIAYDAFKMTAQGKGNTMIDGFTPDQRFFLGFAQVWRLKTRDETMRMRLHVDPHSPETFRVNGPLSNFDPFYAAFNVKEGDKMYIQPEKRAHIW